MSDWKIILGYKVGDSYTNLQQRAYYRMKLAQQFNKSLVPKIQKALINAKKMYVKPKTTVKVSHYGGSVSNAKAANFLKAVRSHK